MSTPWGLKEAFGGLLLAFAIYFLGSNALVLASGRLYNSNPHLFDYLAYQFLTLGVATVAILLILRRFGISPAALGYRFPGWQTLLNAALMLVPIFLGVALVDFLFTTFIPGYHLKGNAKDLLPSSQSHIGIAVQLALLLFSAVEVPFTEETLFRGILYQGLRSFFERRLSYNAAVAAGAVVSGLIFGLIHPAPHTWPVLIFVGIALAYVFQYSRSIYGSVVVHGLFNAVAVVVVLHSA